jgi:L-gulonolactone oxidase
VPTTSRTRWRNWAGNQTCVPQAIVRPTSEDELAEVVRQAHDAGQRVKVVGSGHSFTDVAVTDGVLVDLSHYEKVTAWDPEARQITAQAGLTLTKLNRSLAVRDVALANLGDITYQTISGAISTGTHGTGRRFGNLSSQVVGLRLITGDGSVVACSPEVEPEVFAAARVGVGALGAISTVTLQCVPAFRLHAVEQLERVDDVMADWEGFVDDTDHTELFWIPGTGWAITKRNTRTDEAPRPLSRSEHLRSKVLQDNLLFGLALKADRLRPGLGRRVQRLAPAPERLEFTDESHKVFASPRWVRFLEMEVGIPLAAVPEALERVRRLVDRLGQPVGFPVEVRSVAADDIPLSPSSGRETGYIAVHVPKGGSHHAYFQGVQQIMGDYEGRPHWGKLHFLDAADLAPRYPRWDEAMAVRRRIDPDSTFASVATDRLFGPVG